MDCHICVLEDEDDLVGRASHVVSVLRHAVYLISQFSALNSPEGLIAEVSIKGGFRGQEPVLSVVMTAFDQPLQACTRSVSCFFSYTQYP